MDKKPQMRGPKALMVSIRPHYAEKILDGRKSVELRRLRPNVMAGDYLIIYASTPTRALVGAARVERVLDSTPAKLWPKVRTACGISRSEFQKYFNGATKAYGIVVSNPVLQQTAMSLMDVRDSVPHFRPPQGYWYLRRDRDNDSLLLGKLQRSKWVGKRPAFV